ncbi:ABC transporter C family member 14-like [Rutidosis leptorrhynchoides]|uniref:ABC transporter C family member 14-like n=1 Tax=Rutidosis leptorrhynchoides TaxID=125765 RepID=UPI003A9994F3
MTFMSLITSPLCVSNSATEANTSMISFILLSPCSQKLLLASIDSIFLFITFVFAIRKLYSKSTSQNSNDKTIIEPLVAKSPVSVQTNIWFKLCLLASIVLAVLATVLSVFGIIESTETTLKLINGICWLIQAISFVTIAILIFHETKIQSITHPVSVRIFWAANFVAIALIAYSSIVGLVNNFQLSKISDVITSISLPFSAFFLIASLYGSTGISVTPESKLDELNKSSNVSGWASASIISKTFWLWLNPLLKKGYKTTLTIDDIPTLSPEHRAEKMSLMFEQNWPKPEENSKHPVRTTLIRCYWKDIAFTGVLATVKLSVGYVGPLLIQRFVNVTSGKSTNQFEGYYLVLVLLVAKFIEVLSSHHFNFHSQKLGMLIRSSLITSLYKKGLRLSCSARQSHGVGQIVNYMAVDAQQISDVMLQIHAIWLMPLQVVVALAILYVYLGLSTVNYESPL